MKHCVYALVDPRSDRIFYIGQTSDLARRRAEHLEGSDQISGVLVRQIKLAGFLPLIIVLERTATMAAALSAEITASPARRAISTAWRGSATGGSLPRSGQSLRAST